MPIVITSASIPVPVGPTPDVLLHMENGVIVDAGSACASIDIIGGGGVAVNLGAKFGNDDYNNPSDLVSGNVNYLNVSGVGESIEFQTDFDGTGLEMSITEQSLNSAAGTFVNFAQLDTAQSKFGPSSLLLNGSSDYVTFPDLPAYNLAANDFAIECQVRLNSQPSASTHSGMCMMSHYRNTTNSRSWFWSLETDNSIRFWGSNDGVTVNVDVTSGVLTWNLNQWYHLVVERVGSTITLYRDGVAVGSLPAGTFNAFDSSDPLSIGWANSSVGFQRFFDGWIDEARMHVGTSVYGAPFTPPTEAFSLPAALFVAKGAFTIEMFLYLDAVGGDTFGIIWQSPGTYITANQFFCQYNRNTGAVSAVVGSTLMCQAAAAISPGSWHHIAVSRDDANQCRMWVEGVQGGTSNNVAGTIGINEGGGNSSLKLLGGEIASDNADIDGHMEEFRWFNGTAIYEGAGNITVPTAPFTPTVSGCPLPAIPDWGAVTPDAWTFNKTWDIGGTYDMTSLFTDGFKHLSGFDMTPDGLHMMMYSGANDIVRTFLNTAPFDFTASSNFGGLGLANAPGHPHYHADNLGFTAYPSSLTWTSYRNSSINRVTAGFVVSSSTVTAAALGDTDPGTHGKHHWNEDGTAFYVNVYNGQAHFRRYEVATPWDFTNMIADNNLTTSQYPPVLQFQSATVGAIKVSPDEKYVIIQEATTVYLGTMSTPGDASTMTVDTVNVLNVSPALANDGIAFNSDFTQAFLGRGGALELSYIDVYDTNIPYDPNIP